ncbi:hypothetical protein ACJ73_04260 [Blastomyces percursus]|uniref:Uncharacterized protein n=1 Tax=Blastomyces percursus TaxID=1658174 RepID=A0A1J9Q6M1_9EURO|nr:hypothetical protein ACJ73_04260 [Blastomyces percursus]
MASLAKMRWGVIPLIHITHRTAAQNGVSRFPGCLASSTTPLGGKCLGSKREASTSTKQPVNLGASIASKLSLDGKVTVVTGGTRGVGLTLAERLASVAKWHFSILWSLSVTAAGLALDKPFLEYGWEESRRILDINFIGSFFSAQLAARQMVQQGTGGSIVMISSMAGHCAIPSQRVSMYGASKAAIKLLGKSLGVEMAPHNIRVNTLSPGYIENETTGSLSELEEIVNRIPPMGRIGQPDDLSMAVAYLLSEGASYTTGTDIPVTGGLHNGRIEL